MRIAIIGWPKTGKTTLAKELGGGRSTDELIPLGWSTASEVASHWFDEPEPWIIEGVAVPRALRKWQRRNPSAPPPVDKLIYLASKPYALLTPNQVIMGKGIDTVLNDFVLPWLDTSGVLIEIRN